MISLIFVIVLLCQNTKDESTKEYSPRTKQLIALALVVFSIVNIGNYTASPSTGFSATVAIDISGRSYCNMKLGFKNEKIGDMTSDIVIHFFESFASSAKINIYGTVEGANDHHKAEAIFKAFAKSLKEAIKVEHNQIPSTKGVL